MYGMPSSFSKPYIPRILWLDVSWTIHQVHKHIFILYSFLMQIEE